jgi:hypothetical protein
MIDHSEAVMQINFFCTIKSNSKPVEFFKEKKRKKKKKAVIHYASSTFKFLHPTDPAHQCPIKFRAPRPPKIFYFSKQNEEIIRKHYKLEP